MQSLLDGGVDGQDSRVEIVRRKMIKVTGLSRLFKFCPTLQTLERLWCPSER
jgi:hypothetical protein